MKRKGLGKKIVYLTDLTKCLTLHEALVIIVKDRISTNFAQQVEFTKGIRESAQYWHKIET